MSTNESDDWPFDNEIEFCQFVQLSTSLSGLNLK